jgi:PAS domain-containing protein
MHAQPEVILDTALAALADESAGSSVLDRLPVPVYVTDATGTLTYWNAACAKFAGREPRVGRDKWCVTWHLYTTTGEPLPHDKCPMAEAIQRARPIRDQIAIAERPNGSRRAFRPYPTPLFDAEGRLTGAVNMLIDVTEQQSSALSEQADRCRRLAEATYERATSGALSQMADAYARTAAELVQQRGE